MTDTTTQDVKEDLAQLGIKKSSRMLPIAALIIAIVGLFLYSNKFGEGVMKTYFTLACSNATPLLDAERLIPSIEIADSCGAGAIPSRRGS